MSKEDVRRAIDAAEYAFCVAMDDTGMSYDEGLNAIRTSGLDFAGVFENAWQMWCS